MVNCIINALKGSQMEDEGEQDAGGHTYPELERAELGLEGREAEEEVCWTDLGDGQQALLPAKLAVGARVSEDKPGKAGWDAQNCRGL